MKRSRQSHSIWPTVSVTAASFAEQGSVTSQGQSAAKSSPNASDEGQSHSADDTGAAQPQAPTELLQGTDAPAHNEVVAQSPVTAAAVAMPAPAVAGAAHSGPVQGNEVVAQVLVDALHGGGGGTIEALVNALPNGGASAAEALASHMAAGVSNGDTGVFAGFQGGHIALTMESMMVHQDAVPAHA